MKAYGEVDVYTHVFFTSELVGGEWSASRGKSPQCPLDRRSGGPQSRSGRHGEVKILDPTETRTPVAVPTALSRLTMAFPCVCLNLYDIVNRLK
jgi:hypothetical protein